MFWWNWRRAKGKKMKQNQNPPLLSLFDTYSNIFVFLYPQRFSAGQSEHLEEGVKKRCAACGPKEWTMADWRRWMGLLQVRASIQPADIVIIWASWMGLINILIIGRRNIVNKIIYWAPFAFFRRSLTLLVRNGPFGEEWTTWRQGRLLVFSSTLLHVGTRGNQAV